MSTRPKLLVIDDGDQYVELAHAFLREYDYATRCDRSGPCWTCEAREGCSLTHAHDAFEAEEALARHHDVAVVLLDVAFDRPADRLLPLAGADAHRTRRLQGLAILRALRRSRADLPVLLLTSREELALEEAELELEADELLVLAGRDGFDARSVALLVERLRARHHETPSAGGYAFGRTRALARVREEALALAPTSLPMLLLGEPGTGKSALAEHVIHPASERRGPFVSVDLSSIPETLVAAELFGSARGAFSGAVDREGLFARADGGTLLLDEIGNLPLEVQRMLLLVLQTGRVTRLGETTPRKVSVKLLAATNVDLDEAVRTGRFRADLLARLNPAARVVLPPLRERMADVDDLLRGFVARTFREGPDRALLARYLEAAGVDDAPFAHVALGKPEKPQRGVTFVLSRRAMGLIRKHPFPGNVRELELFAADATLFALADALRASQATRPFAEARTIPIPDALVRRLLGSATPSGKGASGATPQEKTLHAVARRLERELYARLFEETRGDFAAMARALLVGDPEKNARRVRLRFNQLGLRARELRIEDS